MSSPPSIRVLLLGGTGYIGGAALHRLLTSSFAAALGVTLVVRSADKAAQLQQRYPKAHLQVVITTHADLAQIRQLASDSDVVLNAADADDVALTRALIEGLTQRSANPAFRRARPLLLHTSGTSVFSDPAYEDGNSFTKHTYDDAAPADLWALPVSAPHHAVDIEAADAVQKGIDSLIVVPCTIIGEGEGLHTRSIQVVELVQAALKRTGALGAGTLGAGANEWPFIHISDLADAYVLLFQKALGIDAAGAFQAEADATPLQYGREGVFYPSAGQYLHAELAAAIGRELHKQAPERVKTTEVVPFTAEEVPRLLRGEYAGLVWGGSVSVKSTKLAQLGWKPAHPSFYDALPEEVAYQLKTVQPADKQ